jgi:hypothetical protein
LGEVGVLRRQRYVEVHLAPVRYDPGIRGLVVQDALELTVRFDGATRAAVSAPDASRFESVYRRAFLNYEQGRRFRLGPSDTSSAVHITPVESLPRGSTPIQRIRVAQHGVVRLDHGRMFSTDFITEPVSTWRVTNRGVSVPLQTNDDGDDLLEAGEWVQFYGQALDDEPDPALNTDFPDTEADLYEARDFTDVNTYFLTIDAATSPMPEVDATPLCSATPPADFEGISRLEVDNRFSPLGGEDPWYWLPVLNVSSGPTSRTVDVPLPGLTSGTAPARVLVERRGYQNFLAGDPLADQTHLPRATLKNSSDAVLAVDDGTFQGRSLHLHDFTWTYVGPDELTDPAKIELELLPVPNVDTNETILNWVEIRYRRSFTAAGESLVFDWPNEDARFVVDGLTDASPEIYEITRPAGQAVIQPLRLTGGPVSCGMSCSIEFCIAEDTGMASGASRRFVVFGDGAVSVPGDPDFTSDSVSDLRDNSTQADMIVIAHEDVLDDQPASPLSQLLGFRLTAQGGGLTSKIVRLQDVEDEFNHGLPGPLAIREFLRWVLSTTPGEGWADPRPTHVMLLGDGSFDYKAGPSSGNFVPTQMMFKDFLELGHYSSDNVMAAVIGTDQLADLIVARVPARSVTEANDILQKILAYEQAPPGGSWRENVLFVSDRGKLGLNPAEALDFELTNDIGASFIPAPYTIQTLRYWTDYYNNPVYLSDPNEPPPEDGIRRDIKTAVNGPDCSSGGVSVVQYLGHGNPVVWSDDAFFDQRFVPTDTADLCNGPRYPWLLAHNCLTGAFHMTSERTMGEDWLKQLGAGAVAVFSPSGLSFNFISRTVTQLVWDDMFGAPKEREVGVTVLNALVQLCANGSIEPCQHYVFLGDPALRLGLRGVGPPTDIQALGANAQVDLSWTESTTPGVTYDIYRTESLQFPFYTKVNGSPVSGSSFTDNNVSNAITYYYYMFATDPDGFTSRFSHFNTDCDVDGPDCLKATPLNPNPPDIPANLVVEDPGLGDSLQLRWDTPLETDLAYYTVRYGTQSGDYPFTAVAPVGTSYLLRDLVQGQIYFITLTATNTSEKTSGSSNEASDFPVFAVGLRQPRYIDDLVVRRAGDHIDLEWTEVTSDVYGKPEQVVKYEIFRGISPDFDNQNLGPAIGECLTPCTAFRDDNAMLAADSYHYRVRAVDVEGNGGGLGAEAPTFSTLSVWRSTTTIGALSLSWTPVLTRMDGGPVDLVHYEIYAADQPFTRTDVRDGMIPPLTTSTGTTLELTPPGSNRYYSVLAVDRQGNRSPF